jgi:hypothetical protein
VDYFSMAIRTTPTASRRQYPTREGKRVVAVFVNKAAWRQLRQIGLDEDRSLQELMREAVDLLFKKRRLPLIAQS